MADTPLRKLRVSLGLKAVDVASRCDLEQGTFSKIETGAGGYRCSPAIAERLVQFFGPPLTEEMVLYPERYERFMEPSL